MFLLVLPAVLVIIEDTSNFQDFIIFFKLIYTPFKRVSEETELDVGRSQNKNVLLTKKYFPMIP